MQATPPSEILCTVTGVRGLLGTCSLRPNPRPAAHFHSALLLGPHSNHAPHCSRTCTRNPYPQLHGCLQSASTSPASVVGAATMLAVVIATAARPARTTPATIGMQPVSRYSILHGCNRFATACMPMSHITMARLKAGGGRCCHILVITTY